jgi:hypothetical protein
MAPNIATEGYPLSRARKERVLSAIAAMPASRPLNPARMLEKLAEVVTARGTARRGKSRPMSRVPISGR